MRLREPIKFAVSKKLKNVCNNFKNDADYY